MFLEATDLYKTLDLKFNPMDSSHFENKFKQTIYYPTTRANMNEPSMWMTYWRYSGDSRMKKWGHCGAKEKSRGANMIFHCNEDWFAMSKPIKLNIGLWISSEPSPESLQIA